MVLEDLKISLPIGKERILSVNIIFDKNRKLTFQDFIYNKKETEEKLSFTFFDEVIIYRNNGIFIQNKNDTKKQVMKKLSLLK